jgi:hypothetical protein
MLTRDALGAWLRENGHPVGNTIWTEAAYKTQLLTAPGHEQFRLPMTRSLPSAGSPRVVWRTEDSPLRLVRNLNFEQQ